MVTSNLYLIIHFTKSHPPKLFYGSLICCKVWLQIPVLLACKYLGILVYSTALAQHLPFKTIY